MTASKESNFWFIYILISSIFIVSFIVISYAEWLNAKNRVIQNLISFNKITSQNTLSAFRYQESTLKLLGKHLISIDAYNYPEDGRKIIDEMTLINKGLAAFGVARYNGELIIVSGIPMGTKLPNLMKNEKTKESFDLARHSLSMQIGRTYYMKALQKWVIPIRIAVMNNHGITPLVMTAGINANGGETVLNVKELPSNILIQEIRSDGYIQFQNPIVKKEYKNIYNTTVDAKTMSDISSIEKGSISVFDSSLTKQNSLSVSSYMKEFDLYTVVSIPYEHIYDKYFKRLLVTSSLLILLLLILYFIFKRSIHLQEKSKKQIERFSDDLKEKVHVRTVELEESNDELEQVISHLKSTQNKLVESEKMASLGGLVAGVAHEINTPVGIGLTGITHFIDLNNKIKESYEKNNLSEEDFRKFLHVSSDLSEQIFSNLKRTAHLVKSFKQVAVDQANEQKREFYFKEYIQEVLISLSPVTKKINLDVNIECDENLFIDSYAGAYSQIFTNLIMNSMNHAFTNKVKGVININVQVKASTLIIEFKDDGKGISKDDLPKIFDPFYTTYREKGGTGLGLNIIYNIISSTLHGEISCISTVDVGTTFVIKIPLDEKQIKLSQNYQI